MKNGKILKKIAKWILIIGGIDLGLIGAFNFYLFKWLLDQAGVGSYNYLLQILVGISALYVGWMAFKHQE